MKAYAQPTTLNWKATEDGGTGAAPTTNLAPFLQVTDNRGVGSGWNVTVSGTTFTDVSETADAKNPATLKGASLYLNEAQVVGVNAQNNPIAPEALSATGAVDLLGSTEQTVPVFSADANKGQGTWSVTWGADTTDKTTYQANHGVQLVVPVTSTPKANAAYQSTLTWTLSDAPTS